MIQAIHTVVSGKSYLDPDIAQQLALKNVPGTSTSPFDSLSARELDVMMMVVNGSTIQAIAEKLCVSPKTVNSYRYQLYEKLNLKSDVELTLFALRNSFLD